MTQTLQASVSQAEYNDIDQYAQAISGQDIQSFQLGKGELSILLQEIIFPDLVVRRIRTNRRIEEIFFTQPGWSTFSFSPGANVANAVWCGVQTFPNAVGVLRAGREHHTCIPDGWEALEIDVPDELLIEENIAPEQLLNKAMTPEKGLFPLSFASAYRLRSWLQVLLSDKAVHLRCKSTLFAEKIRRQILHMLTDTLEENLEDSDKQPRRHPYKRYPLLRLAHNKIDERNWKSLDIDTLATDLGVKTRTLQRIFGEHYQTPPYQYLLSRRLNIARSALRRSHENTLSIADIAEKFGFSSASQFAKHYA
ncbi:helix-turn-helix domain-containing protein, partial [Pseudomonadota bacterium]